MKKIISLMLVLVMCLGVLTACNPIESIKGLFNKDDSLEDAKTYLKQIYLDYLKNPETDSAFDLVTVLQIKGEQFSVSWAVDNEAITLTPSEDGTKVRVSFTKGETAIDYTLTATITSPKGETLDYSLSLTVPKSNVIAISKALAAEDGTKVTVRGTVVDIGTAWDDGYKNISVTIKDENGDKLYLYRLKTKVELGDIIVATGDMATYNNARQMAAGGTAEIEGKDPSFVVVEAKEYSIPDALKLEDNTPVIVKGTITKINTPYDESYGNMSVTISDADGNTLYVHRLKGNFALGDIITVTGKMTTYDGSKQINAGATAEKTGHDDSVVDPDEGKDDNGGDTPAGNETVTVTMSSYATANGWENSKLYDTVTLNDYINIVISSTPVGEYSANSGKYYTKNSTWRVYANETPSIKFTAADGTTIVSIKITYEVPTGSTANKAGVLTLNGTNIASGEVVTINAATADFSVGNTTEASGNIQITAIEVVYTSGATTPDTGDGDDKGETPDTGDGETPDTPVTTPAWTVVTDLTTLKTGDKILIGNPANGKLFSTQKSEYYNIGIDYSATDFSNVTDDEIIVVTVNADGSYEFTSVSGNVIALGDSYSSFQTGTAATKKTWAIEAKDGAEGIYYIKNVGRGNYIEWYKDKSNWSSYATSSLSDLFELSLYVQSTGTESTAFEKVTADQDDWSGTYLLVWEDGKQAFDSTYANLTASEANGKDVTIVDGKIEATDDTKAITVTITKVDGGYTLKTADGRYLSQSKNLTGYDITTTAEEAGVVTIVWEDNAAKMTGAAGAVYGVDIYKNHNRFAFINTKYVVADEFAAISFYKLAE